MKGDFLSDVNRKSILHKRIFLIYDTGKLVLIQVHDFNVFFIIIAVIT